MSRVLTCMIVDDNLVDRKMIRSFAGRFPGLRVLAEFDDPQAALAAARTECPDILFLDIDMPGMTGFELKQQLHQLPACVFITNFPDYALEGFEHEAFDFLVKPVTGERFERTFNRLRDFFDLRSKADLLTHTLGADSLFVKTGTEQTRIQLYKVYYLEAMRDYTCVVLENNRVLVSEPMGRLLDSGHFREFVRIHRSYAVQRRFVKKYTSTEVTLLHDVTLPVGRSYKEQLRKLLV